MFDNGADWEGVPLLDQTPAQTLSMIGTKIAESPLGQLFARILGGGEGGGNGSREAGFNPHYSSSSLSPSPTPAVAQQPVTQKERTPSIEQSFDASTLASLKGLGQTIKDGKASEVASSSKVATVVVANDFSVSEISAPVATPNPRFGQKQAGMAMG